MEVRVRIYGLMRVRFPGYDSKQGIRLSLPAGASLDDLLQAVGVDREEMGLVLVQGNVTRDTRRRLNENEWVDIFGPIPHGG